MAKRSEDGFPLSGEVYRVISDAVVRNLDMLEGNGNFYNRVKLDVELESGETVRCWIYEFMGDVLHNLLYEEGNCLLWT